MKNIIEFKKEIYENKIKIFKNGCFYILMCAIVISILIIGKTIFN
jgi:hypothetical protein